MEQLNNPAAGGKTFTQEEVNRIVSERLAKEKSKGDATLAEREQQFAEREKQLANREALFDLKDKLKDMGLPAELLPVLNVQDQKALDAALEALKNYIAEQIKTNAQGLKVLDPNTIPKASHNAEQETARQLRKAMHLPE